MVYKRDNIKALIDKFWEGTSSLEEEQILNDYFRYNEYPEEFEGVAAYFNTMAEDETLGEDFDETILSHVEDSKGGSVISLHSSARWLAAAAVAVLLGTSVWFAMQDPEEVEVAEVTLEDPEVKAAFEQAKSALMMVGNRLNEGKVQAVKLNKYNEATEAMKSN